MENNVIHIDDGNQEFEFAFNFLEFLKKKYPERTLSDLAEQYLDKYFIDILKDHDVFASDKR